MQGKYFVDSHFIGHLIYLNNKLIMNVFAYLVLDGKKVLREFDLIGH